MCYAITYNVIWPIIRLNLLSITGCAHLQCLTLRVSRHFVGNRTAFLVLSIPEVSAPSYADKSITTILLMLTITHEYLFIYRVGGAQTAMKMSMSVWLTLHCVITNRTLSVLTHLVRSHVNVGQVSMKSTENVWVCIIIM